VQNEVRVSANSGFAGAGGVPSWIETENVELRATRKGIATGVEYSPRFLLKGRVHSSQQVLDQLTLLVLAARLLRLDLDPDLPRDAMAGS
jgi:hypothetical protein